MEHLIYTDTQLTDVGYVRGYSLDLENGKDNNFTLKVNLEDFEKYKPGAYIYCENAPEYGGRISNYTINSADKTVTFAGRTWRGIVSQKYFTHTTDFSSDTTLGYVAAFVIGDNALQDSFMALKNTEPVGFSFAFAKGTNALTEFEALLSKAGRRPAFAFDPNSKKITVKAEPINDYSGEEYDSINTKLELSVNTMPINHVMAVMPDGTFRHRYLLLDGTQSEKTKEIKGINEMMCVISVSNADDASAAMQAVIDDSVAAAQTCAISIDSTVADIGDIVGGREHKTGIFVKSKITSKILKMTELTSVVNFETGV